MFYEVAPSNHKFAQKGPYILETINLFILPIVVAEAVRRCMKLNLANTWDHLFYYGWNILLCLCSGHIVTTIVASLLMKEIPQVSISYTLMMAICYSVVCFLANLIFKNVSMKVDYKK